MRFGETAHLPLPEANINTYFSFKIKMLAQGRGRWATSQKSIMHFYLQFEMIGDKRNNEVFTSSLSLLKICFLIPLSPLKGHNILLLQLRNLLYSILKGPIIPQFKLNYFRYPCSIIPLRSKFTSHEGRAINKNTQLFSSLVYLAVC